MDIADLPLPSAAFKAFLADRLHLKRLLAAD
jgi:hypothetical protein